MRGGGGGGGAGWRGAGGAGANAPKGVQAENGLPQVNINRLGDAWNDTGQSTENRSRGRCFVSCIDKKRE